VGCKCGVSVVKSKRCSCCGELKPLDQFHRDKTCKDGRKSMCKECRCEYMKKHYAEHRDERREYYKKYRAEHRDEIREYKKDYKRFMRTKAWYRCYSAALNGRRRDRLIASGVCCCCGRHWIDYSRSGTMCTECLDKYKARNRIYRDIKRAEREWNENFLM